MTVSLPAVATTMDGAASVARMLTSVRAVVTGSRACSCGQELDCCQTGHCPRCGITVRAG